MKKIILYILIVSISSLFPRHKIDVAKLEPVEAIFLYSKKQDICAITDTGDFGTGKTVVEAIRDLQRNSTSVVYIDTARYVLVDSVCKEELGTLEGIVRGGAKICIWNGEGDLKDIIQYLSVNATLPVYRDYEDTMHLPYVYEKYYNDR